MDRLPELAHAGGGKLPDKPNSLESVTFTSGGNVRDITDAVFNRVAETLEPHL